MLLLPEKPSCTTAHSPHMKCEARANLKSKREKHETKYGNYRMAMQLFYIARSNALYN